MKEIEVKKHREMIIVVSALVDEKDETQIHIETNVFADKPYSYLADNVAGVMIGIGESIRENVKEQKEDDNETSEK